MVAAPNDIVLTERFTYSGMVALSAQNGYRLHGVAGDNQGLLPEALDQAFAEPARACCLQRRACKLRREP